MVWTADAQQETRGGNSTNGISAIPKHDYLAAGLDHTSGAKNNFPTAELQRLAIGLLLDLATASKA